MGNFIPTFLSENQTSNDQPKAAITRTVQGAPINLQYRLFLRKNQARKYRQEFVNSHLAKVNLTNGLLASHPSEENTLTYKMIRNYRNYLSSAIEDLRPEMNEELRDYLSAERIARETRLKLKTLKLQKYKNKPKMLYKARPGGLAGERRRVKKAAEDKANK